MYAYETLISDVYFQCDGRGIGAMKVVNQEKTIFVAYWVAMAYVISTAPLPRPNIGVLQEIIY